jgi:hypothetical protein
MLAKQSLYCFSHTQSIFLDYFGDGLMNYLLGWPQTSILLISTSQVARIIGISHQCPAKSEAIEIASQLGEVTTPHNYLTHPLPTFFFFAPPITEV